MLSVIFNTMVHENFIKMKALLFKRVILSIKKTAEPIYRSLCENVTFSLTLIFFKVYIRVYETL